MAAIAHNAKLNELVVDLGRSLLQYTAESSPWAKSGALADEVHRLASRQRESVGRLVELLTQRGCIVDFGVYPTDYGDLHFLGCNYFLPKLRESQDALVAELDEAVHTCVDDVEAVTLLREILDEERSIGTALASMASAPAALTPA